MVMSTGAQESYLEFSSNGSLTINYSCVTNLLLIGFINTAASPKLDLYFQLVVHCTLEFVVECIAVFTIQQICLKYLTENF